MYSIVDDFVERRESRYCGLTGLLESHKAADTDKPEIESAFVQDYIRVKGRDFLNGIKRQQSESIDKSVIDRRPRKTDRTFYSIVNFFGFLLGIRIYFLNFVDVVFSRHQQVINFNPQGGSNGFGLRDPVRIPDTLLVGSDFFVPPALMACAQHVSDDQADDTKHGGKQGLPIFQVVEPCGKIEIRGDFFTGPTEKGENARDGAQRRQRGCERENGVENYSCLVTRLFRHADMIDEINRSGKCGGHHAAPR